MRIKTYHRRLSTNDQRKKTCCSNLNLIVLSATWSPPRQSCSSRTSPMRGPSHPSPFPLPAFNVLNGPFFQAKTALRQLVLRAPRDLPRRLVPRLHGVAVRRGTVTRALSLMLIDKGFSCGLESVSVTNCQCYLESVFLESVSVDTELVENKLHICGLMSGAWKSICPSVGDAD